MFSMLKMFARIAGITLLFILGLAGMAGAQSASATLSGTVTDANGAVAPVAVVTITNSATSQQRKMTTNPGGYFIAAQIPPGVYTVSVQSSGFATAELREVTLNVNDQKSLTIVLKVAEVGATVTINDAASIDESPAVATVVNRQFIAAAVQSD
jgi:Carboxypeptidase regulatory-like domain